MKGKNILRTVYRYGLSFDGMDNLDDFDALDVERMFQQLRIPAYQTSKTARIPDLHPHYTNDAYRTAQTVFLAPGYKLKDGYSPHVEGAEYNYSDRIYGWDWDKANTTWDAAREAFPDAFDTAACREHWLRLYWDKPQLELVHIMAGFNVSNGYPYQVYGCIAEPKGKQP